jgi:hypothetical protein
MSTHNRGPVVHSHTEDTQNTDANNRSKKSKDGPTKQSASEDYNSLVTTFITGVILPILVGSFTIPALMIASAANDQSQLANQMTLLSLCSSLNQVIHLILLIRPESCLTTAVRNSQAHFAPRSSPRRTSSSHQ